MFTVKLQRIAEIVPGFDGIPRCVIEAAYRSDSLEAAMAVARECDALPATLQVWIEAAPDLQN